MPRAVDLVLETFWEPVAAGGRPRYRFRLANHGHHTFIGFRLCLTGPARLAPEDAVDGAVLTARVSNFTELTALPGAELAPGGYWEATACSLSYPLRHWTDGATGAYVVDGDGAVFSVEVSPTAKVGHNQALLKGARRYPVPRNTPVSVSVIPWPAKVGVSGQRDVPGGIDIHATAPEALAAIAAFGGLTAALFPTEGIVRDGAQGGSKVLCVTDPKLPTEAYRIDFDAAAITVIASAHAGFLYGFITLGQILRGARLHPQTFTFPASGQIADQPRMGWRGCHLDVARQFYSSAEVTQFLRILAWNKLNRFHWHLSDDEAWRVEIDAYPALTEIGAWRGHGLAVPPLLGSTAARTGGYYTKTEVVRIVGLAEGLGITVVPEIDVPGHCFAMLAAIPALRDPAELGTYASVQGFPNNCLNPALPATYPILETIFDELIALFPAKIIHIGADEVPLAAWSGSPVALDRLEVLGGTALRKSHAALVNTAGNHGGADAIEGSATAVLQAEFLARLQGFLASRGCVTGGWEEAAHGDVIDKGKTYLVGWRDVAVSGKLAAEGYNIVVSPGQAYYLDMANGMDWSEPGAGWAGWSGPRETYDFDPLDGWTEDQRRRFMGIQACIWSEPMTDRAVFDRLTFPRLSAIAETAWSPAAEKSWDRFSALSSMMPILYGHWQV